MSSDLRTIRTAAPISKTSHRTDSKPMTGTMARTEASSDDVMIMIICVIVAISITTTITIIITTSTITTTTTSITITTFTITSPRPAPHRSLLII